MSDADDALHTASLSLQFTGAGICVRTAPLFAMYAVDPQLSEASVVAGTPVYSVNVNSSLPDLTFQVTNQDPVACPNSSYQLSKVFVSSPTRVSPSYLL